MCSSHSPYSLAEIEPSLSASPFLNHISTSSSVNLWKDNSLSHVLSSFLNHWSYTFPETELASAVASMATRTTRAIAGSFIFLVSNWKWMTNWSYATSFKGNSIPLNITVAWTDHVCLYNDACVLIYRECISNIQIVKYPNIFISQFLLIAYFITSKENLCLSTFLFVYLLPFAFYHLCIQSLMFRSTNQHVAVI